MSSGAMDTRATLIPSMRYNDAAAAIEWLCKAFGFEKRLVVPGEDGTIIHSQLEFGNGMIMVGSTREAEPQMKTPRDLDGVFTQAAYVLVADPDAHHDRAVAAGAEIVMPLTSPPHGGRLYGCRDPEGHLWNFGSYDPWAPV